MVEDIYAMGVAVVFVAGFVVGLVGSAFTDDEEYPSKMAVVVVGGAALWPLLPYVAIYKAWSWAEAKAPPKYPHNPDMREVYRAL